MLSWQTSSEVEAARHERTDRPVDAVDGRQRRQDQARGDRRQTNRLPRQRVGGVPFANDLRTDADERVHPLVLEELVLRRSPERRFLQRVLAVAREEDGRTGDRALFAADAAVPRGANL